MSDPSSAILDACCRATSAAVRPWELFWSGSAPAAKRIPGSSDFTNRIGDDPLVNVYVAMENHHFNGKTHYFDWAIFNSYVKLPELVDKWFNYGLW